MCVGQRGVVAGRRPCIGPTTTKAMCVLRHVRLRFEHRQDRCMCAWAATAQHRRVLRRQQQQQQQQHPDTHHLLPCVQHCSVHLPQAGRSNGPAAEGAEQLRGTGQQGGHACEQGRKGQLSTCRRPQQLHAADPPLTGPMPPPLHPPTPYFPRRPPCVPPAATLLMGCPSRPFEAWLLLVDYPSDSRCKAGSGLQYVLKTRGLVPIRFLADD